MTVVKMAIDSGLIDDDFVAAVLAVDFTNPTLSATRCGLLRFVPAQAGAGWKQAFVAALRQAGTPAAMELAENLTDPSRGAAFQRERAATYLTACQEKLAAGSDVASLVELLDQRRAEVFASEISKNPKGQIFEPGFRVIFPKLQTPPMPGALALDESCNVH
jgi:hypothetical protein